jgi:hypothetical protein
MLDESKEASEVLLKGPTEMNRKSPALSPTVSTVSLQDVTAVPIAVIWQASIGVETTFESRPTRVVVEIPTLTDWLPRAPKEATLKLLATQAFGTLSATVW